MTIEVLKSVDSEGVTEYKYLDCENRFQVVTTEGIDYVEFKDSYGNEIKEDELKNWSFINVGSDIDTSPYVALVENNIYQTGICIRYDRG